MQSSNVNSEANWNRVLELVDPLSVADYFLLHIYGATWDWPHNNWVSARERSSNGRYRFYVWDAEGSFGHPRNSNNSNSRKPVNYNVITSDLLSGTDETSLIFQRLHRWPEFRLVMADRIHQHFFQGGVLDDSNPSQSQIKEIIDEASSEVSPLIAERFGESIDLEFWRYWTRSGSSRRSYLLGPNDEHFRNAGYWPETTPPTFSVSGGEVAAGFELGMTAGGGTIYFTLDGSDPRRFGGAVDPVAESYSGPVVLPQAVVTVKARVRSGSGEWSALTESTFQVGLEQPDDTNLVISELHYHPAPPNADEVAAGYNDQNDFEFVQLLNIGAAPIDLSNLSFIDGIDFNFADGLVGSLSPGGRVIVVSNLAAFRFRYGNSYDPLLAGQFGGSLSNGGEQIILATSDGVIRSWSYDDRAPWPEAADGGGITLVLIDPESNPDHNLPTSWTGSASVGGLPGGQPVALTYEQWASFLFRPGEAGGPGDDPDGDGLPNLVEFFLGSLPDRNDAAEHGPASFLVEENGDRYQTFRFGEVLGQNGLSGSVQWSTDLSDWSSDAGVVEEVLPATTGSDGRVMRTFRVIDPVGVRPESYLRLRVVVTGN